MSVEQIIKKYISDKFKPEQEGNVILYNVPVNEISEICKKFYFEDKFQLKTITATDERNDRGGFRVYYVFGVPEKNIFIVPYIVLKDTEEYPSITGGIQEAFNYERKIKTFFGLIPLGHPFPKNILLHENWPDNIFPLRKDFEWNKRPAETNGVSELQKVEGEGIYEIPVGPVHAGIIEPGHFRFSVAGEEIILLEAKLGYKHKGSEKLFEVLPIEEKVRLSERISGDTSFTHSLAFCQAMENLSEIKVPERAEYLRVIFSEMERLANHINDIGFIMLDTGYNFGGSNCARLREICMHWNELLSGNRFLRGTNCIGGVTRDIDEKTGEELLKDLKKLYIDFNEVINIAQNSDSLRNRLATTGILDKETAESYGVIGVAGRALNFAHDARREYPYAAYDQIEFNIALEEKGDVQARWNVRIKEVDSSMKILEQAILKIMSDQNKQIRSTKDIKLKINSCAVGLAEGWRGDIVYSVFTDKNGHISRIDVRDPSFLNWPLLGYAGKGNIVPDFPLINKSFNLSYSGNDL